MPSRWVRDGSRVLQATATSSCSLTQAATRSAFVTDARDELPGGHTVASMTKWEYVTVPLLVHATKQILDNWGQDGWELVQVVPGPTPENLVAYLKRPVPGPA
jgi:hypothetical protein